MKRVSTRATSNFGKFSGLVTVTVMGMGVAALVAIGACADTTSLGARCFSSAECGDGASCFATEVGKVCLRRCAAADVRCNDEAACVGTETGGVYVCLAGGTLNLGAKCTSSIECKPDLVCFGDECRTVCSVDASGECENTETCTAIDEVRGACAPTPAPGPGPAA